MLVRGWLIDLIDGLIAGLREPAVREAPWRGRNSMISNGSPSLSVCIHGKMAIVRFMRMARGDPLTVWKQFNAILQGVS